MLTTTLLCNIAIAQNPLLMDWNTPYEVPPFSEISPEDYIPAFEVAFKAHNLEIKAITQNSELPTFQNTVLAYDNAGAMLSKVSSLFSCLVATDATPVLQEIQSELSPKTTAHYSEIALNGKLFERVKSVYENRSELCDVERRLTEKIYKGFERGGANLPADKKERLKVIDQELSAAQLTFGNNLRADNGSFYIQLTQKSEIDALPENIVVAGKAEAAKRGLDGVVVTLDKASMLPFLGSCPSPELRQKLYDGYLNRANNNDQFDNKETLRTIANLRLERAQLLGYTHHADFVLSNVMAGSADKVYDLMNEVWDPAIATAKRELSEMKQLEGAPQEFSTADWWYWVERLRAQKYDLDENELRPYFALNNVREGIFYLTGKLYGIEFSELTDIEKYNPENQVFKVTDKEGQHLGVLYMDFHPRGGKRVGAWCTSFRAVTYKDGERVAPVVSIVCNFTPPAAQGEPALLNMDEVETFFHEFGHAIHSLVCESPYKGLRSVERDFVELPSQIMEHWAFEPQMLAQYALHYQTGEAMPQELVEKIQNSAYFNQGFATTEFLAAGLLDMRYHTITEPIEGDISLFEADYLKEIGLIEEIAPRYRSTYFQHIFSGGYSSGYYSYLWAEVLDADAYEAFTETGDIFSSEVAARFLEEVLKRGGTADGNTLYKNFRGAAPSREPLMRNRGFIE